MARLLARWRARARLRGLGLWYHRDYAPACLSRTARVSVLPVDRVETALGQLGSEGLLRRGDLRRPRPASFEDLRRIHGDAYLESTMRPETLARIFALESCGDDVDALLRSQRLAVGGTIGAFGAVRRGRLRAGVNLGGGFHHAEPERGGGFCVFNDVAVAIARMRARGDARRVAVVDLDYHQGDGTRTAFARDESVLTYSIHGSVWSHAEAAADLGVELGPGTGDDAYMEALRETLPAALDRHGSALLVYLAGHDVLAGDALGDFALTPRGVLERDRFVVEAARRRRLPLVITLAGGYSRAAAGCVATLLRWLLTDAGDEATPAGSELRRHFSRIAAQLDPLELQSEGGGADWSLSEADLAAIEPWAPGPKLLDFYSAHGVELVLERYGLFQRLRGRGFAGFEVELDTSDRERQIVRVRGRRAGDEAPARLIELVLRRRWLDVPRLGLRELLSLEWLLMEDPGAEFNRERPRLPGQEHPGLGLASELVEMLVQACRRLGLAGLIARPAHYHTAVAASRVFRFLDPAAEGKLRAIAAVAGSRPSVAAARAVEAGGLRLADGSAVAWEAADHVLPVSRDLRAHFESEDYRRRVDAAREALLARGLRLEGAGGDSAPREGRQDPATSRSEPRP